MVSFLVHRGTNYFLSIPMEAIIKTIGYVIEGLNNLERNTLNHIECVVSNRDITYACAFNHEWQAHCPEVYIEENV